VVVDILGVVNDVPVPNDVPPVNAANQFNVPALAVAPKVTVPVAHLAAGVVPDIVGTALTVATTALLVAVVQPFAVAST
jgi:hypothetical protein